MIKNLQMAGIKAVCKKKKWAEDTEKQIADRDFDVLTIQTRCLLWTSQFFKGIHLHWRCAADLDSNPQRHILRMLQEFL